MASVSELCAEMVAARLEIAAQLAMVVDLAVEDDPDRAVFVGHRLVAAGAIDDRQTAMAERLPRGSKWPPPSGPR